MKVEEQRPLEVSLYPFMERIIAQLKQCGRHRTSEQYQSTLNSIKRSRDGRDIAISAISADDMLVYEGYLQRRGICPNTTSAYMRVLRAVYNRAVELGITEQCYPFRRVYTGVDKTAKRAIPLPDIKRIKELSLANHSELSFARDLFLFSFYTRGMAFVDMAYLRKRDIQGGFIVYRRHKTKQLITVKIEPCTQEIIDRYSTATEFIFPIIKHPEDMYRQYRSGLRTMNAKLKKIGELIGTPVKLTTYVGRHSWGSAAKNSNIPISVISESMGHNSEATTRIYLAEIDTSVIDEANEEILKKL